MHKWTNPELLCNTWKRCTWIFPDLQCPTYNKTEKWVTIQWFVRLSDMLNYAQYLQLKAEWNSKHLKPLHLKVYTNGSFVIFVKGIFAKSSKVHEKS